MKQVCYVQHGPCGASDTQYVWDASRALEGWETCRRLCVTRLLDGWRGGGRGSASLAVRGRQRRSSALLLSVLVAGEVGVVYLRRPTPRHATAALARDRVMPCFGISRILVTCAACSAGRRPLFPRLRTLEAANSTTPLACAPSMARLSQLQLPSTREFAARLEFVPGVHREPRSRSWLSQCPFV
eukprot:1482061-Pleurochrysis_carterae.AAC.4